MDRVYAGQSGDCFRCGKPITVPLVPEGPSGSEQQVWVGIPKRSMFTPRTLLVLAVGGLVATGISLTVLVTLILPLFQYARETTHRQACSTNLRQIHAALMAYQQAEGSLPPAYVADAAGKPMHSWRVLILPYLGENTLYQQYDFSVPWDAPRNMELVRKMPSVYACPADPDARLLGETNYMVIRGAATLFPNQLPFDRRLTPDAAATTILVAEVPSAGMVWSQPADLDFAQMRFLINIQTGSDIGSHHRGGAHFLMADGTVQFLLETHAADELRSLAIVPP